MPELIFERQVWHVQVAHLHSAACASPSFQILSICTLIDDKNKPISAHELDSYCKKNLIYLPSYHH